MASWPSLGGQDVDVDSFIEEFEELMGLANDGKGMHATERVHCIRSCLRGSRIQAFQREVRAARREGRLQRDPHGGCQRILERLREFKVSLMERHQRVSSQWNRLSRDQPSAAEFLLTVSWQIWTRPG